MLGVESKNDFGPCEILHLWVRNLHGGRSSIQRNASPWKIHRSRIEDANYADCSRCAQSFSPFSACLGMCRKRRGKVPWRSAYVDHNFTFQIEPCEVIVVFLWNFQP